MTRFSFFPTRFLVLPKKLRELLGDLTKFSTDNYTKSAFDYAYTAYFFGQGIPALDFQYEGSVRASDTTDSEQITKFFEEFGFEKFSSFYEERTMDRKSKPYEGIKFASFMVGEYGYIKIERRYQERNESDWLYFDVTCSEEFEKRTNFIQLFIDKFLNRHDDEKEYDDDDDGPKNTVSTLVQTPQGFDFLQIKDISRKFVPDNYPPDIAEAFTKAVRNIKAKQPFGRLTLLSGKPGTGKTFFIRGLIDCVKEAQFVLVDPNIMANINQPSLIRTFLSFANKKAATVLLLEDADSCLVSRMSDNIGYISSLLNLTDGIYGDALNIHVVASTNQDKIEIDEALKRPGRLNQTLTFRPLSEEEALRIFRRETGKEPECDFERISSPGKARKIGISSDSSPKSPQSDITIAEVYRQIGMANGFFKEESGEEEPERAIRTLSFMKF